jgi:hypothetical protein
MRHVSANVQEAISRLIKKTKKNCKVNRIISLTVDSFT